MNSRTGPPRTIRFEDLPKHFDSVAAEGQWRDKWEETGIYRWDPAASRQDSFVVDTPPPTVSGTLHVGHVFSYTQTDFSVRYKRMRGFNIFYPMGWDDNGLPTERRVQNFYHVRCDPTHPYEPDLEVEEATAKIRKQHPRLVSRRNFIELCDVLTKIDERAYLELWQRIGVSVDWQQTYATIDSHSQRTAQFSFLDLYDKGHVYQNFAPTLWDVDFQTAVAQAEAEDRSLPGAFYDLEFGIEGSDETFVISTTRPELLPACVGVCAHPDDERFTHLFGRTAISPLFRAPVPIFATELADPEKGTGILMVCTFGDPTDVIWWREQGLALRQILGRAGRLEPVEFGSEDFPSEDPESANRFYAELAGRNIKQARARIVELLADPAGAATGGGAPLQGEPETIEHAVKFYEKGDRPLELLPTRQWFVRLMDKKDELLAKGAEIRWHPSFMHGRYADWTQNLSLDWCLSRQRYFGVPIPVWYPLGADGEPDHDAPILATPEILPVDPMSDPAPGFEEAQRGQPGGFVGEGDIFDTWFTSSMTPQISSHFGIDESRHASLFPADIRPQAHDIIRTWTFYTIAKSLLHEDSVPWKHVLLSGWILDPDRKKMGKSKGNTVTPVDLIDKYSADAIRYWAASARLGVDHAFDESLFKIGRRLTTKIFNASKFVLSQATPPAAITHELDRAFVAKLRLLVEQATASQEDFNYAQALADTESFFWSQFTDTYLELCKQRARGEDGTSPEDAGSAVATLRLGLDVLLRLFAPVVPFITEEVWSWAFADEHGAPSIHGARWPAEEDFAEIKAPAHIESFGAAIACQKAIHRSKADAAVSTGRAITSLAIAANRQGLDLLAPVIGDVMDAVRARNHTLVEDASLEDGEFSARDVQFAPDERKGG